MAETKFDKLKAEATKLGIPFKEDVLEDDLIKTIKDKKDAIAEENRIKKEEEKKAEDEKKKNKIILKDVFGEDVSEDNYFYKKTDTNGKIIGGAPSYFNKVCGLPVDREELITVFNRIFDPKHGFLFYKTRDTEIYIIIVPLKHSDSVGTSNDSQPGDFQKHAISFINEGSVNLDSLKLKLTKVASTIKIKD